MTSIIQVGDDTVNILVNETINIEIDDSDFNVIIDGGSQLIRVKDTASVDVYPVGTIIFPRGAVTDNDDGTVTISFGDAALMTEITVTETTEIEADELSSRNIIDVKNYIAALDLKLPDAADIAGKSMYIKISGSASEYAVQILDNDDSVLYTLVQTYVGEVIEVYSNGTNYILLNRT